MSKLVDDVKSGLKGVRGAGDALRGGIMEATDKVFEKDPNHPTAIHSQAEKKGITEKGKQDLREADEMFARREWERKGVAPPPDVGARRQNVHSHGDMAPNTHNPSTAQTETYRPTEGLAHNPHTAVPGQVPVSGGATYEPATAPGTYAPGGTVPDEPAHYGSGRPTEGLPHETGANMHGSNIPYEAQYGSARPAEGLSQAPGADAPQQQRYM